MANHSTVFRFTPRTSTRLSLPTAVGRQLAEHSAANPCGEFQRHRFGRVRHAARVCRLCADRARAAEY